MLERSSVPCGYVQLPFLAFAYNRQNKLFDNIAVIKEIRPAAAVIVNNNLGSRYISDIFGNTETIVIFLCNRIFFLSA